MGNKNPTMPKLLLASYIICAMVLGAVLATGHSSTVTDTEVYSGILTTSEDKENESPMYTDNKTLNDSCDVWYST